MVFVEIKDWPGLNNGQDVGPAQFRIILGWLVMDMKGFSQIRLIEKLGDGGVGGWFQLRLRIGKSQTKNHMKIIKSFS